MTATLRGASGSRRKPAAARRQDRSTERGAWDSAQSQAGDIAELSFHEIAESIPHIVWLAGSDGSTQYLNRHGTEYTGLGPEASQGWRWLSRVHPDDVERARSGWGHAVKTQTPYALEYRLRRADGEFRRHAFRASPVHDGEGLVIRWIGTATDIEDQQQLQEDLRQAQRQATESLTLLESLLSTAPVGLGFVDRDFRVLRLNESLAATSGIPIEEQLGRTVAELVPELWPQLEPLYRSVLETGEAVVNQETTGEVPGTPGETQSWLTSFYPVRVDEKVIGIGIVVVDITERKRMEAELKLLADCDPLTGLLNRRRLVPELTRMVRYAARYGHHGAVVVLDIDHFKVINDSRGHAAGDQALRSVADLLRKRTRDTDVVARLGGDEFAVVLAEATKAEALKFASDVRSLLSDSEVGAALHASVGISLFTPNRPVSPDDALASADVALYQAKENGGNQAQVYSGHASAALTWIEQIRTALAEDRYVLHGQPIVDLGTGMVAYHELLIRMLSTDGVIIQPARFLPIAEQFQLIGDIDRWVTKRALRLASEGHRVTINLSGPSIGDQRVLDLVRRAIANGLDPANVIFEITETAAITNFEAVEALAATLNGIGCALALDDFGTGFASFAYLKHVNARYLKIDAEFINGIKHNATDQQIVKSIVGIAHSLGKLTIAEGIEDAATLAKVKDYGVDFGQGYWLGQPEPLSTPTGSKEHRAPPESSSAASSKPGRRSGAVAAIQSPG